LKYFFKSVVSKLYWQGSTTIFVGWFACYTYKNHSKRYT